MKEWIEKRLQEMKSNNVIPLDNWREYYNNKGINERQKDAGTQTHDNSGRGEPPHHK